MTHVAPAPPHAHVAPAHLLSYAHEAMTEDRQLNGVEFRADVTTRDCTYRYLDVTTWRYQRRAVWLNQDRAVAR